MIREELDGVASQIDELLRNDDFPRAIEPKFLREAVESYPFRGGKRLRPALVLWSCGVLGGGQGQALYPAAACEVFHNWTLVHDDVIDRDDFRRDVPTCHKQLEAVGRKEFGLDAAEAARFGNDFAMLAGDLQQGWANALMLHSCGLSRELTVALNRRLQEFTNRNLISGEALDVAMSYRDPSKILPSDVEKMFELKTGVLFQFCAETGAMIALADPEARHPAIRAWGKMACAAAVAFQMRDDYLGIFGDPVKFGKPIGSDLTDRKATMLLVHSLAALPPRSKAKLVSLLGKPSYTEAELEEVRALYKKSGAVAKLETRASELSDFAREQLEQLPDNYYRNLLNQLLDFLLSREV